MSMWHPWRRLRELEQVRLEWQDRDDEMGHFDHERDCVTITVGMTQAERRCTMTHELIHRERGPVPASRRDAEELAVNKEAAHRLIDIRKLGEALAWTRDPSTVADELWVDVPTLEVRMRHLHPAERHYLRRRLAHLEDDPA